MQQQQRLSSRPAAVTNGALPKARRASSSRSAPGPSTRRDHRTEDHPDRQEEDHQAAADHQGDALQAAPRDGALGGDTVGAVEPVRSASIPLDAHHRGPGCRRSRARPDASRSLGAPREPGPPPRHRAWPESASTHSRAVLGSRGAGERGEKIRKGEQREKGREGDVTGQHRTVVHHDQARRGAAREARPRRCGPTRDAARGGRHAVFSHLLPTRAKGGTGAQWQGRRRRCALERAVARRRDGDLSQFTFTSTNTVAAQSPPPPSAVSWLRRSSWRVR